VLLVVTLLAFALALGLSVSRVGPGVYLGMFTLALIGSFVFLIFYQPSL